MEMSKKTNKKWAICCNDMCLDGTYIWFAHSCVNILFCIDIETECVRKMYIIPYEEYYKGEHLYEAIISFEDFIWLIPAFANRFVIFDKRNESFDSIEVKRGREWEGEYFFSTAYQYNDFLYCLPGAYSKLIRINLRTREQVCLKDFAEYGESYHLYGYNTSKLGEHIVVRTLKDGTELILIDLKEEKINRLKTNLGDLNVYEMEIAVIDQFVYMCSHRAEDSFLRKIDLNNGNIVNDVKIGYGYKQIRKFGNNIVVDYITIPRYEIYNREMQLIFSGEIKKDISIECLQPEYHLGTWKDFENGLLGCFHNGENLLYIYRNCEMNPQKVIEIQADISYLEIAKSRIKKEDFGWQENKLYALSDFLNDDMKKMTAKIKNAKTVGKSIFKSMTVE